VLARSVARRGRASGGAVLGPTLAGKHAAHDPTASASASAPGKRRRSPGDAAALDPIIVDVRRGEWRDASSQGGDRHRAGHGVRKRNSKSSSRAMRDAAISYLRALPFDQIASPTKFDPSGPSSANASPGQRASRGCSVCCSRTSSRNDLWAKPTAKGRPARSSGRPLDLSGRERQLRGAMIAMDRIGASFARYARRSMPFLVRNHARLLPAPFRFAFHRR